MRVKPDGIITTVSAIRRYNQDEIYSLAGKPAQVEVNREKLALVCFVPASKRFDLPVNPVIETEDHITFLGIVLAAYDRAESITCLNCKWGILSADDPVSLVLRQCKQAGLILFCAVFQYRFV